MINRAVLPALMLATALILAACGSSPAQAPAATASRPAASAPASSQPPPPAVHVSKAGERVICANINVMVISGNGDPYTTNVGVVAGQYQTSQYGAELIIAKAIGDECPSDASVIPPGAPAP